MGIEKNYIVNSWLEFYGPLLTKKQRAYMKCYYSDDLSLGEISANFKVSRQAVYDNLTRTVKILKKDEEQLHLYRNFVDRNQQIDQMQKYLQKKYPQDQKLKQMIQNLEKIENR